MKDYVDKQLDEFDNITMGICSPNQVTRIQARFMLKEWMTKNGFSEETTDEMIEDLKKQGRWE